MNKEERKKRVRYSDTFKRDFPRSPQKCASREGTILRESRDKTCYVVLWDGTKTGMRTGKQYIEIIDQPA